MPNGDQVQQAIRSFQKLIASHAARQQLFDGVRTLVIGVSGGADSVALLDWLVSAGTSVDKLIVAHLNHRLRGDESDADEQFVAALARQYGLPFVVHHEDVAALACQERMSLEEAGREARYRFFRRICTEHSADAVAVAHHADDQAETFLLRLLRGSGAGGLSAMRSRSAGGWLIRPLLHVRRWQIETYLRHRGLAWREDASNSDQKFLRNRVRHELLPLLQTFNPSITDLLCQSAYLLAEDDTALENAAREEEGRHAGYVGQRHVFNIGKLLGLLPAIRSRLLRRAVAKAAGTMRGLDYGHLQNIEQLMLSGAPSGRIDLPGRIRVERAYNELRIYSQTEQLSLPEIIIHGAGRYPLGDGRILTIACGAAEELAPVSATSWQLFSRSAAPFPWHLRYFRPGDRFVPSGMQGHQKLKDYFINNKIPRPERSRVPLLLCGERIICICGHRIAAGVASSSSGHGEWAAASLAGNPASFLPE